VPGSFLGCLYSSRERTAEQPTEEQRTCQLGNRRHTTERGCG
jgi:hypothetical protein